MPRICVVGLGNPGARYERTRHNVGFDWVDAVVEKLGSNRRDFSEKFESLWLKTSFQDAEIHFLKPQTFMNESGRAVSKWLEKFQGDSRVLSVFDDLDLPLGRLRLRASGSDGGHRGLRSIIEHIGTDKIDRLRLGIGRPAGETIDYVLEKMTPEESNVISNVFAGSLEQLKFWLGLPIDQAMSKINGLNFTEGIK